MCNVPHFPLRSVSLEKLLYSVHLLTYFDNSFPLASHVPLCFFYLALILNPLPTFLNSFSCFNFSLFCSFFFKIYVCGSLFMSSFSDFPFFILLLPTGSYYSFIVSFSFSLAATNFSSVILSLLQPRPKPTLLPVHQNAFQVMASSAGAIYMGCRYVFISFVPLDVAVQKGVERESQRGTFERTSQNLSTLFGQNHLSIILHRKLSAII